MLFLVCTILAVGVLILFSPDQTPKRPPSPPPEDHSSRVILSKHPEAAPHRRVVRFTDD